MFARPGLCGMGIGRLGLVAASQPSLVAQALAILAEYGSAANLYLQGVGTINGITAGNWLDTVGGTAATVDGAVGTVVNARGGANLVQGTSGNRPILRLSGGVYAWDFVSSDSFTSTLTPGNAGFFCMGARFIDSGTVRTLVGAGAGGPLEPGVWLNRSIDGNLSLIGDAGIGREAVVTAACPTGTTFVASCGWITSSMFVGVNSTETNDAKTRSFTSTNTVNVGVLTGTTNPMLGTISGGSIIMPTVLPTASERATLRQFIASLSGVAL